MTRFKFLIISAAFLIIGSSIVSAQMETDGVDGIYCPNLTKNFRLGYRDANTGGQVSELQQFLIDYFNLEPSNLVITGIFGRVTRGYVQQFQSRNGVVPTGIIGAVSRTKIASVCTERESTFATTTNPSFNSSSNPLQCPVLNVPICNGVLSPTIVNGCAYYTCTATSSPTGTQSCTVGTTLLSSGVSQIFYRAQTASAPVTCQSLAQARTCTNGVVSGDNTYVYPVCNVQSALSCTTPWGTNISHGSTTPAYLTSSVATGQNCTQQIRTCDNGVLSGNYTFATCTVAAATSTSGIFVNSTVSPNVVMPISWVYNTPSTTLDWIGIATRGQQWSSASGSQSVSWFYTNAATSGNKTLLAPITPGLYDLVYYLNNSLKEVMRVGFEVISTTEPAPNLQVGTPVFTPEHGNLYVATPGTEITITATNATSIRYTLDNSMPSCSTGVVYSNTTKPKITTVNMTLKAVACNNSSVSAVNSRWYTVDTPHSTLFNFSDIRGGVGDDANGFDVKKYITPTPVDAVYVKSKAEFEQAVASSSGKYNYIVLKDGVYDLGKQYIYRTKGVYTYIRAEHPGCYDPVNGQGVTLNGKTEFYVYNDGWTIEGLCFDGLKNADSAGYNFTKAIWILAGNVVVSQNVFKNFGNATDDLAAAILVGGKSNFEGERKTIAGTWIVRNHFSNIKGLGVDFPTPHPSYTGPYLWSRTPHVQYNTFEKSPLVRENGGEAIHLGTGWPMDASFDHNMRAVIQYNYFNEWNGDGELIGIKSSFNTVLGNLINNSGGGISVRYGDNNTIENNYMLGNPDATCALRSSGYGNVFKGNKLDLASSQIALCITAKHKEPGLDPYGRSAYQTVASKNTYFQSNVIKNSQNFVWLLKYGSVYPLDHYPPTIDDIPSGNQIRSNTLVNMSQAVKFKNDSIPEFGITDKMLLDNNFIE